MTWLVSFWGLEKDVERVAASGLLESFDVAIVDGKVVLTAGSPKGLPSSASEAGRSHRSLLW